MGRRLFQVVLLMLHLVVLNNQDPVERKGANRTSSYDIVCISLRCVNV